MLWTGKRERIDVLPEIDSWYCHVGQESFQRCWTRSLVNNTAL